MASELKRTGEVEFNSSFLESYMHISSASTSNIPLSVKNYGLMEVTRIGYTLYFLIVNVEK